MPDAAMMIMTYAITAALASAGGAERATRQPALPLAFAAKAWYDFATCLRLRQEEWADNKALCSWCQLATLISAVTAALSLPEAVRAGQTLLAGADEGAHVAG
jgi:hypothetical protein